MAHRGDIAMMVMARRVGALPFVGILVLAQREREIDKEHVHE
jgi:hypothetical protein